MGNPLRCWQSVSAERTQQPIQPVWQPLQQSVVDEPVCDQRTEALRLTRELSRAIEREPVRA